MLRQAVAIGIAGCLAAACSGSSAGPTRPQPTPSASSSDVSGQQPLAQSMQRAWVHGVGIDAPRSWPRNALRCGVPVRDTIVVTTIGWGFHPCRPGRPRQVSIAWIGDYRGVLHAGERLGRILVTSQLLGRLRPTTLNGIPVLRTDFPLPGGEPADLVVLPHRHVFVLAGSPDAAVTAQVVDSVEQVVLDPRTGCPARSRSYDDVTALPEPDQHRLVPGRPTSADACYYVDDWLEGSAVIDATDARTLAGALDTAPPAPVANDCFLLPEGTLSNSGPMVLQFRDRTGVSATVVARIVSCHAWRSYVSNGVQTHRLTAAALRLIPRLWGYARLTRSG